CRPRANILARIPGLAEGGTSFRASCKLSISALRASIWSCNSLHLSSVPFMMLASFVDIGFAAAVSPFLPAPVLFTSRSREQKGHGMSPLPDTDLPWLPALDTCHCFLRSQLYFSAKQWNFSSSKRNGDLYKCYKPGAPLSAALRYQAAVTEA